MADVRLQTSNYQTTSRMPDLKPRLVAISLGLPKWLQPWTSKHYTELAPPGWLLKAARQKQEDEGEEVANAYYTELFQARVLAKLRPDAVLRDIGRDAVMLCFENVHAGEFCHRRLVAEWFQRRLSVEVPELIVAPPAPKLEEPPKIEVPPQLSLFSVPPRAKR